MLCQTHHFFINVLQDIACEELDNEQKDTEEEDDFISEIEEERRREEAVYEKERVKFVIPVFKMHNYQ